MTKLKAIIKTIHLKLLENLPENPISEFNINNSRASWHRKAERQKGLVRGCLRSYLKIHAEII